MGFFSLSHENSWKGYQAEPTTVSDIQTQYTLAVKMNLELIITNSKKRSQAHYCIFFVDFILFTLCNNLKDS